MVRSTATCGDVRLDRSALPGRPVRATDGRPLGDAADVLALHGWPRAVPFDAAEWTVAVTGDEGVLVARPPGGGGRYLPIRRAEDGAWTVGAPCALR